MKNKTTKKKCGCKAICMNCKYIMRHGNKTNYYSMYIELPEPKCTKYSYTEINYVTGEINKHTALCKDKNKNGDCKKYKLNVADADKKKIASHVK